MKNIISCHYCKSAGITQNLAELLPSGMLKIQRFDSFTGNREFSVIKGDKLDLICGNCGNIVYQKNEKGGGDDKVNGVGTDGIFRFTLVETTITLGTPSYSNFTGSLV